MNMCIKLHYWRIKRSRWLHPPDLALRTCLLRAHCTVVYCFRKSFFNSARFCKCNLLFYDLSVHMHFYLFLFGLGENLSVRSQSVEGTFMYDSEVGRVWILSFLNWQHTWRGYFDIFKIRYVDCSPRVKLLIKFFAKILKIWLFYEEPKLIS
jgi:hypothetical protein